ncbi:MAG: hypothetical protein U0R19_40970 [Bryobacteraceae bacterium]
MALEKYDDVDYHCGSETFAENDLPMENGATHIGFYMAWVVMKGRESEWLRERAGEGIRKLRAREMTGREFLLDYCDGKLVSLFLNEEMDAFTRGYYEWHYIGDYMATVVNLGVYEVEDSWENYEAMAGVLEKRYV